MEINGGNEGSLFASVSNSKIIMYDVTTSLTNVLEQTTSEIYDNLIFHNFNTELLAGKESEPFYTRIDSLTLTDLSTVPLIGNSLVRIAVIPSSGFVIISTNIGEIEIRNDNHVFLRKVSVTNEAKLIAPFNTLNRFLTSNGTAKHLVIIDADTGSQTTDFTSDVNTNGIFQGADVHESDLFFGFAGDSEELYVFDG